MNEQTKTDASSATDKDFGQTRLERVALIFQRRPYAGLLLILAVYLLLTILHSIIVPITQGEDELAHYRYIKFIAQTGRLPVNAEEREQAWYRSDWPPLYHLLVGWAVSPLDTTHPHLKDVGESPHRRLVGEIFYPRLIIYTADAAWPWQDGILAWHLGRFISILLAGVALIFTYLTVLELGRGATSQSPHLQSPTSPSPNLPIPPSPNLQSPYPPISPSPNPPISNLPIPPSLLAFATTALLAFTPRFLFTSAMLGDDSLFILLSALFIWLLLRTLRGDDRWGVYIVMGLLLGLSIATKYSTGLLPLVIIPVVWWRARQTGWRWWQSGGRVAVSWLATILGASWWFGWIGYYFNTVDRDGWLLGTLSGILNTGPDVSMRRVFAFFTGQQFSGQERPDAIEAGTFGEWGVYLFQTFWGVPVLEQDPLFPWAYLLMLLFCLLAIVGLWRLWRTTTAQMRMTLAVLLAIFLLLLPFPILRFFLTRNILETGQGRHILYPAAQSIPLLLMLGWVTFLKQRPTGPETQRRKSPPYVLRFTFYVLLLLLIWAIFQLSYMTITYPDPLPVQTTTFAPQAISQPLYQTFDEAIHLRGYDLQPNPTQPGDYTLTLFWEALDAVDENYRVQVQAVDAQGDPALTWLGHPLNGIYPTRAWDEGDIIRDRVPLSLVGVPPGAYRLRLNLLREAEAVALREAAVALTTLTVDEQPALIEASTLGEYEYRLDVDGAARWRQTLPLVWTAAGADASPEWALVGPDDVPRPPTVTNDHSAMFNVGPDWPSGAYRLRLVGGDGLETEPLLTVANEPRLFELPPVPDTYTPVEANFGNQVKLLGYSLPTRRVEPGGGLPLTLYWQSLAPVLGDYVVFDVLLDEQQQVYGGYDRLPREYYSTILWAEGEVVEDGFGVPVRPDAPPGVYHLHVGLYSLASGEPVSLPLLQDGQVTEATSVVIGPLKVGGPPPEVTTTNPTPQVRLNQAFEDQVTLLGYDLTDENNLPIPNPQSPSSHLNVTLYWRAETDLQSDYTTFLHLRDPANNTVTQQDNPPANGRYPTSLWERGEIIIDEISLPLDSLPLGEYTPVVGLYNSATGDRLFTDGLPTNEVRLESVTLP